MTPPASKDSQPVAPVASEDPPTFSAWLSDVSELVKLRLSFLVVCTTLVGYVMGRGPAPIAWGLLAITLFATALSACGASALNQWLERSYDARMKRTRNRPLAAGRMHSEDGLLFGIFFCLLGAGTMAIFVNTTAALLVVATVVIYVAIYTPLKRITDLNTLVGAIPGALPPLIGWTAATGEASLFGWMLFAILFFWQMPHFLAIAWMYRDDYKNAGFVMLTGRDETGEITGLQAVSYAFCLLLVSLLPTMSGLNNVWYFFGAFLLGCAFLGAAAIFLARRSEANARRLFLASILYLPLLLVLLVTTPASR